MNFKHAIGFMVVGALFGSIPNFAPGWCPLNGVDGSSTRGLWLEVMSTLQIGIAMTYFAARILASIGALLESAPTMMEAEVELPVAIEPQASASVVRASVRRTRPATILPLPVGLESELLESRRAA